MWLVDGPPNPCARAAGATPNPPPIAITAARAAHLSAFLIVILLRPRLAREPT
jgi:hypothetical protein